MARFLNFREWNPTFYKLDLIKTSQNIPQFACVKLSFASYVKFAKSWRKKNGFKLIRELYGPPWKQDEEQQHLKLGNFWHRSRVRLRNPALWMHHKSNPRRYKSCGEIIHHVTSHHSISRIRCFSERLLLICTAYRVHQFLLSSPKKNSVDHYLYWESFFIPSGVPESSYQKHQMCVGNVSSGQI